ncbi:MAG: YceD family protein [Mariprofundaceae bacterium]|nr:YceD family protein [Mariprofundaceae bacterium]
MQVVLIELASTGWQFNGTIPKELLQDCDVDNIESPQWVCSDVICSLDLQREYGDFKLDIEWSFDGEDRCMRCQDKTVRAYQKKLSLFFSFETDDETRDLVEKPGDLNILDILREEIWLNQNQSSLCKKKCKGLCTKCGVNRNRGQCQCDQVDVLHPFAGLRSLAFEKKD